MNYDELQQGIQENLPIPKRKELWEAIEKGDLEKYTPKQIEEGMLQEDSDRDTLYHDAAQNGHLDKIPKELLTAENLLQPSNYGKNCLHYAAYNGQLAEIPRELLTAENLLKLDGWGSTCLHKAAMNSKLGQIPWLSYETLNNLLEKKLKRLEIIARSQTINHDTDIL
jgi:ankyrin repeat protein